VIIHTIGDKAKERDAAVVHVEGDPDHPINRGTLCPKGSSLEQDISERPAPAQAAGAAAGSDSWEDIAWDQAIEEIGRHIKKTRDETFITTDAQGRTVESPGEHGVHRRLHRHE